jgi:hypothetical protein
MYKLPGTGVGLGGAGTLAVTGFDYAWWTFFAMIILIAGAFLFRAAQRHNRPARPGRR